MEPKEQIETEDGKVVRMSKVAYVIASKHFGARKLRQAIAKEKPIELLKMPIVIKQPPVELKKEVIQPPVKEAAKAVPAPPVQKKRGAVGSKSKKK